MDMTFLAVGRVRVPIDRQHADLRALRDENPDVIIPFAAVDPRQEGVVEKTIALIEDQGFRGIKLYPPLGYDPADPRLEPLYAYAEARAIPLLSHCSRYGVYFRGRKHPVTGEPLPLLRRPSIIAQLADPARFVPVLDAHPRLKLCLAHFGGQGEWDEYLRPGVTSWLATILEMIATQKYENLYTDVSYTLFAADRYVHVLKDLLADAHLRSRVLYGSDFYVVEDAKIDEASGLANLQKVLGAEWFQEIGVTNPDRYLAQSAA